MSDLLAFLRSGGSRNMWFGLIAAAIPLAVVGGFLADTKFNAVGRNPVLVYMKSWPVSRSEVDVLADQRAAEVVRAANNARVQAGQAEARKRLKAAHIDAPWWNR